MNTKNKKIAGFTLIELMVASTIATILLVVSFSIIGNVYFTRKQINIAQSFYSESRFLLEKIVTIARENTIDYDRYFEEIGPNPNPNNSLTTCNKFDDDQGAPEHITSVNKSNSSVDPDTSKNNRITLGYPNIFYWLITDDIYRNLGGVDKNGNTDPCAQAFHGETLPELYLINEKRNIRTSIKLEGDKIQTEIQLGADTNNDGIADLWGYYSKWENNSFGADVCNIYNDTSFTTGKRLTLITNEEQCYSAHEFQNISANRLSIDSFNFTPYPDRDPFLNFRNDAAQIHPNIFLFIKIDLKDAQDYGFENTPTITMQTSVSSRIFDDTRK